MPGTPHPLDRPTQIRRGRPQRYPGYADRIAAERLESYTKHIRSIMSKLDRAWAGMDLPDHSQQRNKEDAMLPYM